MEISIIICTYNRAESLRRTLASIAEMVIGGNPGWEVIIVDNNSSDHTKSVAYQFMSGSLPNARYVFEPDQGLSHARNKGIHVAKGKIISFLDDDVIVDGNWLMSVAHGFELYDPMVLGGRVLPLIEGGLPSWFPANHNPLGAFDLGTSIIVSDSAPGGVIGIGANMSFKKQVFERYGLFDPALGRVGTKLVMGEETELCRRIQNNGHNCIYYPDALVHHCVLPERLTKKYLRKWYFYMGQWYAFADEKDWAKGILILGVPRWMYAKMVEDFFAYLMCSLQGKAAAAQDKLSEMYLLFGYMTYIQGKLWRGA